MTVIIVHLFKKLFIYMNFLKTRHCFIRLEQHISFVFIALYCSQICNFIWVLYYVNRFLIYLLYLENYNKNHMQALQA